MILTKDEFMERLNKRFGESEEDIKDIEDFIDTYNSFGENPDKEEEYKKTIEEKDRIIEEKEQIIKEKDKRYRDRFFSKDEEIEDGEEKLEIKTEYDDVTYEDIWNDLNEII